MWVKPKGVEGLWGKKPVPQLCDMKGFFHTANIAKTSTHHQTRRFKESIDVSHNFIIKHLIMIKITYSGQNPLTQTSSPSYLELLRMSYRMQGTKFSKSERTNKNYVKRQTLWAQWNENWSKNKKLVSNNSKLASGDFSWHSALHIR